MVPTKILTYKTYQIIEQKIAVEHGTKAETTHRYTVERPNNGGKVGKQTYTLIEAQTLVDKDLAVFSQ